MTHSDRRYSTVAIVLHWVMAALLIFMIWLGKNMVDHEVRFQLHKSLGITLLVLTIARIVWRLFNAPPTAHADIKPLENKLSKAVQFGFYLLMLAIPLLGWMMVSASPFQVPTVLFETISWPSLPMARDEGTYKLLRFLHGKLGVGGFVLLLVLHITGALKHELGNEMGVLKRIIPGYGKAGSPKPSRGFGIMLLASLGFFGVAAAVPLMEQVSTSPEPAAASANIEPNWQVESGRLSFSGVHDGTAFEGVFETWDAQIGFYENDLPRSEVLVTIDLSSALTGTKLYDDSLRSAEWFDIKTLSSATAKVLNIRSDGDRYMSDIALTLKAITTNVPFEFDLNIEGDVATMTGQSTLSRSALNLGQISDAGADWVDDNVVVNVELKASKK